MIVVQQYQPLQLDLTGTRRALSFARAALSSIVEVERINGSIVNSEEAAEEHGLKLCKHWVDNRLDRPPTRRYSFR